MAGNLEIYDEGKRAGLGIFAGMSSAAFIVAPRGGKRGERLEVDSDGKINWKLPPGDYDVVDFQYIKGSATTNLPIDGSLSVSAESSTTDIGVIRVERGRFGMFVRAEEPSGASSTEAETRAKSLKLRRPSVGSYSAVVDICNPRWWISCSESFHGVTAVEPIVDFGLRGARAAQTESLRPAFRWTSTLTAGAVYDLVIWKGVGYKPSVLAKEVFVPGAVAFYAEGLEHPDCSDVPLLEAASHYFWSVRLRQGGTVSTWSTTGHFTFMIVAMSSSSGRYFEFDTP